MKSVMNNLVPTRVVGNDYVSDQDQGFKSEVKGIFESYMSQGINLADSFGSIITSPSERQEFTDQLLESFQNDPMFTSSKLQNAPFYNNFTDRVGQLVDNSMNTAAMEAVMQGYAPIVAYNPFFLKKQWVSCVFKDVLMTEVPTSPVINLAYEKRYIKTANGDRYEIPEIFYDTAKMKTLVNESMGLTFDADAAHDLPLKNEDVLVEKYVPGIVVAQDKSEMLTQEIYISAVSTDGTEWVPVDIRADVTTHNWLGNKTNVGTAEAPVYDTLVGNVDFMAGTITVLSTNDKITKVKISGRLANRFNERSLDVERRVEQIQHVMPESGPRFNTPVTIEEAADALALQKIDMIADNVDVMGRCLAEFEDLEIRSFLQDSYDRQKAAPKALYDQMSSIVEGTFNMLPYEQFSRNISDWQTDSREYFERVINQLKQKLKTPEEVIVAVAHPTLIRFLQNGIDWVFTDETQISGMKIAYNFGIMTSGQDRVHIITSHYLKPEDGIMFVVIPTTKEVVTFKHYKYDMVIDRGYRSAVHSLVPNIMATHRTLTFEVDAVQGRLFFKGHDSLQSPETLKR